MGWYCHPDTLCIAIAQGHANRTGHKEDTLEWLKAYRTGYEMAAHGNYPESLARYLLRLDDLIAEREAREP